MNLPRLTWPVALGIMLLLSFVTRWGSITQEVLDWDESTFIVLAGSVARGHLPYVEMWDIKPPLFFLIMGGAMHVFGESIATARAVGLVGVAITALFVTLITARLSSQRNAWVAGFLFIFAAAAFPVQPAMTETVELAFLMASVFALLAFRHSLFGLFLVGLLISLATLTRTNLATTVIFFGILISSWFFRPSSTMPRRLGVFAYVIGGLIPLGAVIWLYWVNGELDLFWTTNVDVVLNNAGGQRSFLLNGTLVLLAILVASVAFPDLWGSFLLFPIAKHASSPRTHLRKIIPNLRTEGGLIASTAISVWLGMALSGNFTWHHLLQLAPFLAIGAAVSLPKAQVRWHKIYALIALVGLAIRTLPSFTVVLWVGPSELERNFPIKSIAEYIQDQRTDDDEVLVLAGQLLYFYLAQPPMVFFAVHPSNIIRDNIETVVVEKGLAPPQAFEKAVASKPRFVLMPKEPLWYLEVPRADVLHEMLAQSYRPTLEKGDFVLYERL